MWNTPLRNIQEKASWFYKCELHLKNIQEKQVRLKLHPKSGLAQTILLKCNILYVVHSIKLKHHFLFKKLKHLFTCFYFCRIKFVPLFLNSCFQIISMQCKKLIFYVKKVFNITNGYWTIRSVICKIVHYGDMKRYENNYIIWHNRSNDNCRLTTILTVQ